MRGVGIGASLASMGEEQKHEAVQELGKAADEESARNAQNTVLNAQRKSANQAAGASVGALAGMQFGSALGPWGAVIGGAVGYIAGGLF